MTARPASCPGPWGLIVPVEQVVVRVHDMLDLFRLVHRKRLAEWSRKAPLVRDLANKPRLFAYAKILASHCIESLLHSEDDRRDHVVLRDAQAKLILEDLHEIDVGNPPLHREKHVLDDVLRDAMVVEVLLLYGHADAETGRFDSYPKTLSASRPETNRKGTFPLVASTRTLHAVEPVQEREVLPVAHEPLREAKVERVQQLT